MFRKQLKCISLAVMLSLLPFIAHAQDKAQLPYSIVRSYLELFKSLEHLNLVDPTMIVGSTNPAVPPQAIEFKIKTSGDWETFRPEENGVIQFPDQPDWDNLTLISNQPRGTLELVIGFAAKQMSSTTMSYQDLMGLVPQFNESLAALANMQGEPPPDIKGLTIQLSEGSGAALHVLSKKGKKTLKSTSNGVVIIRYNEALWQENPPIEFDEVPVGIVPLS